MFTLKTSSIYCFCFCIDEYFILLFAIWKDAKNGAYGKCSLADILIYHYVVTPMLQPGVRGLHNMNMKTKTIMCCFSSHCNISTIIH